MGVPPCFLLFLPHPPLPCFEGSLTSEWRSISTRSGTPGRAAPTPAASTWAGRPRRSLWVAKRPWGRRRGSAAPSRGRRRPRWPCRTRARTAWSAGAPPGS
eukprot:scaffold868_cov249-Pinguiococcus_pyrenoidosus.AAC.7